MPWYGFMDQNIKTNAARVLPGAGHVRLDDHAGPPSPRRQPQPSLSHGADGRARLASSAGIPQHEPQPDITHRGDRAVLSPARRGPPAQSHQGAWRNRLWQQRQAEHLRVHRNVAERRPRPATPPTREGFAVCPLVIFR